MYGETTPLGLPNPRYNQKVYTNPGIRASVGGRCVDMFAGKVIL